MTAATVSRERVRPRAPAWVWAFLGHELLVAACVLMTPGTPAAGTLRENMMFFSHAHFLFQYDSLWFLAIAHYGYRIPGVGPGATVFFPLLPLVLHVTGARVGLVVQQGALAAVFWLLYRVLGRFGMTGTARVRALWLFAVNPAAIYFSALYAETWMMLSALAGMELAASRRYPYAAAAGFLGSLAAAPAVLTGVIPLVLLLWRLVNRTRRDWAGIFAWGAGIGAGVGAYAIYLAIVFGHPLLFVSEQHRWNGVLTAPWTGWLGPFLPAGRVEYLHDPGLFILLFAVATLLLAGSVFEVQRLFRRRDDWSAALLAYVVTMTVLAFSFGTRGHVYHSTLRFLSPIFPAYMGLAARLPSVLYWSVATLFTVVALRGGSLFAHGWFFQ